MSVIIHTCFLKLHACFLKLSEDTTKFDVGRFSLSLLYSIMIRNLLFIALGGALGSVLRYLTSVWTLKLIGQNWFFSGTTAANIIGCFLIGIAASVLQEKGLMDNTIKLFLIVGFLGGFTTFSSFGFEGYEIATLSLQKSLMYLGFQVLAGMGSVWAGISVSKWFY